MIKNVVFDLGGVVLGRDYAERGELLDFFSFLQGDRQFPEFWKDFDLGRISQREVAEALARSEGCDAGYAYRQVTTIMHMFDEFPETVELVKELSEQGYKIYVLSNMPREFYDHIKQFGVFDYFDGVVISSEENMIKPDPRFFNLLLDRYGLDAGETLFVDDKPTNTDAAAELGFHVCHFTDSIAGCDHVKRILGRVNG